MWHICYCDRFHNEKWVIVTRILDKQQQHKNKIIEINANCVTKIVDTVATQIKKFPFKYNIFFLFARSLSIVSCFLEMKTFV